MSIYGINGSNFEAPRGNEPIKKQQDKKENFDIGNALRGVGFKFNQNKTPNPISFLQGFTDGLIESKAHKKEMTKQDKKDWIKNYQEMNGCSKKEAKKAFEAEFEKLDKMSRKNNAEARFISKNLRLN